MIKDKKSSNVKGKTELYAYVKPTNKQWLKRQAKKKELTLSKLVDKLCDQLRKQGDVTL